MKTLFRSTQITDLERRAFERIEEIVKYYGGDEKLRKEGLIEELIRKIKK